MILLWGPPGDPPLTAVRAALRRAPQPVAFLDQRQVLETTIELHVGTQVTGQLGVGTQLVDLGTVTAVYLRPYDSRRVPEVERAGAGSPEWGHALQVEDILLSWLELTPALVVNRPAAMATNNSKPYQATRIQAAGFQIPQTLITTDPVAARAFWALHGTVIYKSVSGVRSIVARLTPDHGARLDDIAWCPTQFQQYIPGEDYRVHVVGTEVFACRVVSQADDYRYATRQGATTKIEACVVPQDCAEQCTRLAAALDLPVAGIDLRQTPDGDWFCFEVNPSPGFTYYQAATNQPVDQAIAQLLLSGGK